MGIFSEEMEDFAINPQKGSSTGTENIALPPKETVER